ncbi:hypothetical protein GYB61_13980, partial [bacterium]|nr:hypothetical protein [bacterium]
DGVTLPNGVVSLEINGFSNGQAVDVTLPLPAGARPDTYYTFVGGSSFEFLFDGTEGAQISGNIVTLRLVDGGLGDADGAANGVIVDPGAPGATVTAPPAGGNSGTARVSDSGALSPMLLYLLSFAVLWRRRKYLA